MKHILSILLACTIFSAQAMKIEVHKNIVYASGAVGDDVVAFQEAFSKPGVDTVVFVNSPGGDGWTGLRVARLIADKKLNTVIAGFCSSACSVMFMGGKERTFSDSFLPLQTYIGIHGAHNKYTKSVDSSLTPTLYAFYKQTMDERFNPDVINAALYGMEDAGSMLRVFDAQRTPKRISYHCKGAQTPRQDCKEFKDADALNLGIVTSNTLTKLELPAAYKYKPTVFGRDLTLTMAEPVEFYKKLTEKTCTEDACRRLISVFEDNKTEHKAIAIPMGMPGLGTVTGRNSAHTAFMGAVYFCNHVKGKPVRLCETQMVNNFDVSHFYSVADGKHVEALANLKIPNDMFFANEEYGGVMTSFKAFKTQKWNDITPQKLEGVKTYSTKELATALKSDLAPVVINVFEGVQDAIPSAQTLVNAGLAFDDTARDAEFEQRYSALLKLLSPDQNKPIVFYCASRDLWLSVNAAMRAKKLGYTNVGWYRGGYESWKAANLPMADVVVRAVAN
jgi:rhodanese-related sulfurtransferase